MQKMQWKYAEICSCICQICRTLYIAYFAFICTPHFADGMGKEGQKSWGLSLAVVTVLSVACCDGHAIGTDWPESARSKSGHKVSLLWNLVPNVCYWLFHIIHNVHLNMGDGHAIGTDWPESARSKSGQNVSLHWNLLPNVCYWLFHIIHNIHLNMVDDSWPCTVLEIWDLHTWKS